MVKKIMNLVIVFLITVCMLSGCRTEEITQESTESQESQTIQVIQPSTQPTIVYDETISGVMSSDDIQALYENPILKYLDVSGSTCYEEIQQYITDHPDVEVVYTVDIGGSEIAGDAAEMTLTAEKYDLSALTENAAYLPNIAKITFDGVQLEKAELMALGAAFPNAVLDHPYTLFGKTFSLADEKLEYLSVNIGNEGIAEFRDILPLMRQCTYFKLDRCKVDDEVMAKLRDDFPQTKVVWRVFFAEYSALTDEEKIWTPNSVLDIDTEALKYCTDVKYIDMGHNDITSIEFCRYMPKLEVAIFAITKVNDISPLAYCPELEYLEIFSSKVTDISPLANCTKLQHLNISNLPELKDLSPLYGLTQLKRMRCTKNNISGEQQQEIMSLLPDCAFNFSTHWPTGDDWRYDENRNRVERYELLAQQIGYDTNDYSRG